MSAGPAIGDLAGRLGFAISVPTTWYELELRPGLRDDAIRRLVEERTRGNDEMWAERHAIRKLLVEQATDAWAAGAVYAAGFSLPTEEGPVTGSLTITLVEDLAAEAGLGLEERFRQVARPPDPLAPYAESTVVELPTVGRCARSAGIQDSPLPGGQGSLRNVFMITAAPLPAHRRTFLVAASSPVLPLAEALLDLFDAVTGTFRVVEPKTETETETKDEEAVDGAPTE